MAQGGALLDFPFAPDNFADASQFAGELFIFLDNLVERVVDFSGDADFVIRQAACEIAFFNRC